MTKGYQTTTRLPQDYSDITARISEQRMSRLCQGFQSKQGVRLHLGYTEVFRANTVKVMSRVEGKVTLRLP